MTVTSSALLLWIAPVVFLAMCTHSSTKPRLAVTLSCEHVAALVKRVCGGAGARLTAQASSKVPEVRGTLVAVLAHNIGPAGTVSSYSVTIAGVLGAVGWVGPLLVAGAASAAALYGVSIVTRLAFCTVGTVCVIQTLQALATARVT